MKERLNTRWRGFNILLVFVTCYVLPVTAQDVVVSEGDRTRIENMLADASLHPMDTNWMMYFGGQFVGQPYVGGTLDRDTVERLVVDPSEVDCTTFIEYIAALTKCAENRQTSFEDFCQWLLKFRYLGGNLSYCNRKHYFTVWMQDNQRQGLCKNIVYGLRPPVFSLVSPTVNWMTTHQSNYRMLSAHPEWVSGIRALEKTIDGKPFRYIPKALLKPARKNNAMLREYINDGDIIVLITNLKGLETVHVTMAHWRKDGLHVMHASSYYKRVVDDSLSLYDYMKTRNNLVGICVCRVL